MKKYYIGIDLGGTNIKSALYSLEFEKIGEVRSDTEAQKGSQTVLSNMLGNIERLLDDAGVKASEVCCMGIGIPGVLDIERGISIFAANFADWENVPISEYFEKNLGILTYIDNDIRVNLYGEWYFGAGKGKNNIVMLTLGTGLGSAVIVDGHMLYGACGSAGEMGHMNMYRHGRECRCGSSGCFGRYVSALGMINTVKEKLANGRTSILSEWTGEDTDRLSAKMVSDAFDAGDEVAVETMNETGEVLGFGLVNVVNLFNPEIIIIGGGMSAAGERLLRRAREVVNEKALKVPAGICEIRTAALGDSAGMLGAAVFASRKSFGEAR